jgi:hypothetical protein
MSDIEEEVAGVESIKIEQIGEPDVMNGEEAGFTENVMKIGIKAPHSSVISYSWQELESGIDQDDEFIVPYFKNFYEFTFESFVQNPEYHLNKINKFLKTNITRSTKDTLKRERIPRKLISDGRNLEIYRRVGWKKIKAKNKVDEYIQLHNWAFKDISRKAKKSLDWLISDYKILERKINEI